MKCGWATSVVIIFLCGSQLAATNVAVISPSGLVHPKRDPSNLQRKSRGWSNFVGRIRAAKESASTDAHEWKKNSTYCAMGEDCDKPKSVVRRVNKTQAIELAALKTADVLHMFKQYLNGSSDMVTFHFDPTQRNYSASVAYCAARGHESVLASIRTKGEQVRAASIITEDRKAFTGAENDGAGVWTWRGGWPWSYVGPNAGLDGKDGARKVVIGFGGVWTEVQESFLAGALCREKQFNLLNPDAAAGVTKFFGANGKCFKLQIGSYIEMGSNVPDSAGYCLEPHWRKQYSLGKYKNTSSKAQFFTAGSAANACPDGSSHTSNLALYESSSASDLQATVDEVPKCNFAVRLLGPLSAFSSATVTQARAATVPYVLVSLTIENVDYNKLSQGSGLTDAVKDAVRDGFIDAFKDCSPPLSLTRVDIPCDLTAGSVRVDAKILSSDAHDVIVMLGDVGTVKASGTLKSKLEAKVKAIMNIGQARTGTIIVNIGSHQIVNPNKQESHIASAALTTIGPIVGVIGLVMVTIAVGFVGNYYGWFGGHSDDDARQQAMMGLYARGGGSGSNMMGSAESLGGDASGLNRGGSGIRDSTNSLDSAS